MAKNLNNGGRELDPVKYGEVSFMKRMKGTPYTDGGTGFDLTFNYLPPGMNIGDQTMAIDVKEIVAIEPIGPIFK